MKKSTKSIISILLSLSFLGMPIPPAKACAPDLAYAILINGNHPDLPLKLFAAGNIGIVQPGWAKSYLVVAYRYLSGKPLSKLEQDSIVKLWHDRIAAGSNFTTVYFPNHKDEYLKLRAKALGADKKDNSEIYWKMDKYVYDNAIGDTAFALAKDTLASLLKKYPPKSKQIRDWVKAQDGIFGIGTEETILPQALPKSSEPILQECRNYQIAAANFYLKNFDKAAAVFQQVADQSTSGLKQTASYMVLRSKANQILKGYGKGDAAAVSKVLQKAADGATKVSTREDILDLLRPISYMNLSTSEVASNLASKVLDGTSKRFGRDVGDLTFLLDGNPPLSGLDAQGATGVSSSSSDSGSDKPASEAVKTSEAKPSTDQTKAESRSVDGGNVLAASSDLSDFVLNIQKTTYLTWPDSPQDKAKAKAADLLAAKHAREMWSKTKSPVWLVAALSGLGLRLEDDKPLYEAAESVPENSPAYLTARFYLIDSLISNGKRAEARKLLQPLLARPNLPPTSHNLFTSQMAAASETVSDYLKFAVLNPPEILSGSNDLVSQKFTKLEAANKFQTETPGFDSVLAMDMNRNAPLSTWMQFVKSENVPAKFKPILVRTVWTRAEILQKDDAAARLEPALAATNPSIAGAVAKIKNAPAGPARQFAVACLILRNFGMSPYMQGGTERHAAPIGVFDWYNNNFWVPLPLKEPSPDQDNSYSYNNSVGYVGDDCIRNKMKSYWQPGISRFLTAAEKKNAEAERQLMLKNHPSKFLGQTVLDWAKTHPGDPDIPEMLYRVVRLPKWTEVTPLGSEYSKKAYFALHKAYPGNQWTKKAVCYY